MSRAGLALRAVRLAATRSTADPTPDYDVASDTYDDAFTSVMGTHSTALLEQLRIEPGDDVVELACGTGHLTSQIVRRLGPTGSLTVVEKSGGMLAVARAKVVGHAAPGVRLTWYQDDMMARLSRLPDRSANVVVVGWAICYAKPVALLREAARVLRPGGQIGIIETRADALRTLRSAFEDVVAADPSMLTGLIRVNLPKGASELSRWFRRAGLRAEVIREGDQEWPCRTAADALEWVERSGAGAGFRDSFDMSREAVIRARLYDALQRAEQRSGGLRLAHPFVVGVARAA